MNNSFIISSKPINCNISCKISGKYFLYAENTNNFLLGTKKYELLIDGYVLPKSSNNYSKVLSQTELIINLFKEHNIEFIHLIKGYFIIVIASPETFYLFTHRAGIKKVFTATKGSDFLLSNNLILLKSYFLLKPDLLSIISYCLFNNHLGGKTFFENVSFSPPASFFSFEKKLITGVWFKPESLKTLKINKKLSYPEIAELLYAIVKNTIRYLQKDKYCLTLTGGMDSRLTLSAVLKNNVPLVALVYGNPLSKDVVMSVKTGDSLKIPVFNYFLNSKYEYAELVNKIIEIGFGMINLHRAHRYFAYRNFCRDNWSDGVLFTGHMGGEMIRNFYYDRLIINDNIKYFIHNQQIKKRIKYLQYKTPDLFLKESAVEKYFDELSNNFMCDSSIQQNEFNLSFNFLINVHHAQDIILSETCFDMVYPFYMDDEVVDLLFETANTFYHHNNKRNAIASSIYGHKFYCEVINILYPPLAELPFGKRGYFTAKEYVNDNKLLFVLKRIKRYIVEKEKYAVNFSYHNFFKEYLIEEAVSLSENLYEYFNIEEFLSQLKSNEHGTNETYWRKYSNIIFINKILKKLNE